MIERKFNQSVPHDKLRLHSSERNTPFGKLFKIYKELLSEEDIRFYPNTEELNPYIENFYGYQHFLMGFGSDRCIKYFFELNSKKKIFQNKKKLIITDPSFPMYGVYGEMFNIKIIKIKYDNLEFPIDNFIKQINKNSLIVFSNPSSPIGDLIKTNDLKKILDIGVPTLIDEAYIEFSNQESSIGLISKYSNLYVTRSLSKAGGSAGTRFGVIFSQKQNIEKLQQYRDMYETTGQTFKWVKLLLNNKKIIDDYVLKVKNVRNKLLLEFNKKGIFVIGSQSNWLHIKEKDLKNLPKNIIFKKKCNIPNSDEKWIRLQITDNINDYKWIF